MKIKRLFATGLVALSACFAQSSTGWKLAFSDEFSGAAGASPDTSKWGFDLGNGSGGWGNLELENYTSSPANCSQDGAGHLLIQAVSGNGAYTSCRMKTLDRFNFTYGRVEARAKLPYAQGIWPAIWLLGSNPALPWPSGGEIDIAENFGAKNNDVNRNHATVHGPGYEGAGVTATYTLPSGQTVSNGYHVYAVDWEPGRIEFFLDGKSYQVVTPASLPAGGQWVFDNPEYLILNLAVGGSPAPVGPPDASTMFPQQMLVDYVRVYQKVTIAGTSPNVTPDGAVGAADFGATVAPGALAAVFGVNLCDATFDGSVLFYSAAHRFAAQTPSGCRVKVNGTAAALTFASPTQINFQIPWASAAGAAPVSITVERGADVSFAVPLAIASAAPALFGDYTTGTALVTGCTPAPGATCVAWGTGFGAVSGTETDGAPYAGAAQLACLLTIDGKPATVLYCGAAPSLLIDQLNFVYPDSLRAGAAVDAVLSAGGSLTSFTLPGAH